MARLPLMKSVVNLVEKVINGFQIIAERKDVLNYAFVINENMLVLNYTVHVKEIIEAYDLESAKFIKEIPLPGIVFNGFSSLTFLRHRLSWISYRKKGVS